jgi:hypothetical protein
MARKNPSLTTWLLLGGAAAAYYFFIHKKTPGIKLGEPEQANIPPPAKNQEPISVTGAKPPPGTLLPTSGLGSLGSCGLGSLGNC